jgi:HK97 family phage major capsid protein
MDFKEIKSAVDQVGQAFDEFKGTQQHAVEALKAQNTALQERVEELESKRNAPRPGGAGKPVGYKSYDTNGGRVYVLPHDVKVADVAELRPQQAPEVSMERWLAAAVAGEKCGDKIALEYAKEQKQMTTGTTGIVIPGQFIGQWIDLLRAQSVLQRAGVQTLLMDQKTVTMGAVASDPAATWHTEAGSINASNPTFAVRSLSAQTLVTRCQSSLEVSQDSPDFGSQLAQVMTRAMAAELDRVGLEGDGTPPEPRGILNTVGRSSESGVGAVSDYSEIVSGVGSLLKANCDLDAVTRFALMSPDVWAAYEKLVTGISSDKTPLMRPKSIENMQFLVTSNIAGDFVQSPDVSSTLYLGDWRDMTLGIRREASIDMLRLTTYASNLLLEFVGYLRADYVVRRPASFHTVEDITS